MTTLSWRRDSQPTWDEDRRRIIGGAPDGAFELPFAPGDPVSGQWWAATVPDGTVVGFGWLDVVWGEAEILLATAPDEIGRGVGAFVLENLEREAAGLGVNYVFNTVAPAHPHASRVRDWLISHGFDEDAGGVLRKRVGRPAAPRPSGRPPVFDPESARGPGREDAGGYVAPEDHRY